jgi:5-methylcytosine-specific restriction endonuclease McrA
MMRNEPIWPRRAKRVRSLEESAVLAAARRAKQDADAAEARKLAAAVEWARLHEVTDPDDAETWGQTPITLAGEGAPMIAHGCVAEFAAVIGTSTNGGRAYLESALELAHRLPHLYARTQAGTLPAWKARRIAAQTTDLTPEAVAHLDVEITPVADALSAAATEKKVAETIAALMPEHAQSLADANANHRVVIDHRQVSFLGTSTIHGALDLADALDLDDAVTRIAEELKTAGSEDSLDARRATALGRLARGEAPGRQATLYIHLPADTTTPTALVENRGPHLLTRAQVATWLKAPEVKITLKPVIDLRTPLATSAYTVPDKIREHIELRDRTCAFPGCDQPARNCQHDHITSDADGGPTATDNLAPLCQHHHNQKTHNGWTYTMLQPGIFLWRSPHGYTVLRDHTGTHDLTPRTLDPPGS